MNDSVIKRLLNVMFQELGICDVHSNFSLLSSRDALTRVCQTPVFKRWMVIFGVQHHVPEIFNQASAAHTPLSSIDALTCVCKVPTERFCL